MKGWDVFNGDGKWMDTVYFTSGRDADHVTQSLIDNDDYPHNISIKPEDINRVYLNGSKI